METNLNEIKSNIRGILSSSKHNLSVQDLQKEYRLLLGNDINYKTFGHQSIIELLQSLSDIITLPDNPNEKSIICFNVSNKTKHLKMLIDKQKSNSKNHSRKCFDSSSSSSSSSPSKQFFPNRNNNSSCSNNHRNRLYYGSNKSPKNNQQYPMSVQNNFDQSPNYRNNNHKQRHCPNNNYLKSQSPSTANQNEILSPGVLTDRLRLHVENVLRQNNMFLSLNEFKKTVKEHQDFPLINAETISKAMSLFDSFIEIVNGYVFLKDVKNNKYEKVELAMNVSENSISKDLQRDISRIFNAYNEGLSVEHFELLYNILFNNVFDPTNYKFEKTIDVFKYFKHIVHMHNNLLYRKFKNKLIVKNDCGSPYYDKEMKSRIKQLKEVNQTIPKDISFYVEWEIFRSNQDSDEKQVKLAYVYDPTLFYLNLSSNMTKLSDLMTKMKLFYDGEYGKNYEVEQHQVYVGMVYATSFNKNHNRMKMWYRVRVLDIIGSDVKVIHVDHGIIDLISIMEIKFLKEEFAVLPCQAIQCRLSFCEKLIKTESLTNAFLKICKREEALWMTVDKNYIFDSFCNSFQILHVTLFQKINITALSDHLHNVNFELLIDHVN